MASWSDEQIEEFTFYSLLGQWMASTPGDTGAQMQAAGVFVTAIPTGGEYCLA